MSAAGTPAAAPPGPVGIIMLVHTAFDRAEQVARHWTAAGCPVVIHVDKKVAPETHRAFVEALGSDPKVRFCTRHRCEWGGWGIVAASQSAARRMLMEFPDVRHVFLASGSCLPLRPVRELIAYLGDRSDTDFIESATTADVPWIVGGLGAERFTLRFPFSWKHQRRLFDGYVQLQRRLRVRRRLPRDLVPHMGSQWWCLTRKTLSAILNDPRRPQYDAYFRRVWIPDESYFQSLARLHSTRIESRSLTLAKFDYQGKPHIFYDDHLELLRRSDCFVARKIWPRAERLYDVFLKGQGDTAQRKEPNPGKIDRIFSKAVERRTKGRAGLFMQSRFPRQGAENGLTAAPYSVFQGFNELFVGFETWLARATGAQVHGHLFAPERAEFVDGQTHFIGCLSDSAALRDYNPEHFLASLLWNTRGERQCLQFGPRDSQGVNWFMARDNNAQISLISGVWAVPLFHSGRDFSTLRAEAARLQHIEAAQLQILRSQWTKAKVRIWTLAEFLEAPGENLRLVIEEIMPPSGTPLPAPPPLVELGGFGRFLQDLKNQGMHPYLMGDFPSDPMVDRDAQPSRKPYLAR